MSTSTYTAPREGEAFNPATRKYYRFTKNGILVVRGWPEPAAWRKTQQHPYWQHCRPSLRICRPEEWLPDWKLDLLKHYQSDPTRARGKDEYELLREQRAVSDARRRQTYRRFLQTIPLEITRAISPFRERNYHLLSWLARCNPYALEFLQGNAALGFLVANSWAFHKVTHPMRTARSLLRQRRPKILAHLGFMNPTTATVRLLAKIDPGCCSITRMLYLRDALNNDPLLLHKLAHLRRLNAGVLRITTDPTLAPAAAPSLLEEIAAQSSERKKPHAAFILKDAISMAHQMGYSPERLISKSIKALERKHDELVRQFNTWQAETLTQQELPLPTPFPGNGSIIPIRTTSDLLEEARSMEHCVLTWLARILQDQAAVYRVELEDERATLGIVRFDRRWRVQELRGHGNSRVSRALHDVVHDWILELSHQ